MINNFELILTPDAMKIQRVIIQKISDGDFEFVQKMNNDGVKIKRILDKATRIEDVEESV